MTYPNAHAGVRKLFSAHILMLLAVILIVGVVVYFLSSTGILTAQGIDEAALNAMLNNPEIVVNNAGAIFYVLVLGAIVAIVAYVMLLVGNFKAGKDEKMFMIAFGLLIGSLILSLAVSLATGSNTERSLMYCTPVRHNEALVAPFVP